MARTTEHMITASDLRNLMTGEGGVDLERIAGQSAMRIVGVKSGTTAQRLGAQNGDTIESINDTDVAAKQDRIVIKGKRGDEPYVTILQMTKPN